MPKVLNAQRRMKDYERGLSDPELMRKWDVDHQAVKNWRYSRSLQANKMRIHLPNPSAEQKTSIFRAKNMYHQAEHSLLEAERELINLLIHYRFPNEYIAKTLEVDIGKVRSARTQLMKNDKGILKNRDLLKKLATEVLDNAS